MRTRLAAAGCLFAGLAGTSVTYLYFVRTAGGQRLDERLTPSHGLGASNRLLAAYDRHVVVAELLVLALVVAIAARRGQLWRGLLSAVLPLIVVVEVNAAKDLLRRPVLTAGAWTHNSFPSGHVALAAATVVAAVLVLPMAMRVLVGALGGVAVALVAAATVEAGWHRFSDGLGAVLLSIAAGALVVLISPSPSVTQADDPDQTTRAPARQTWAMSGTPGR